MYIMQQGGYSSSRTTGSTSSGEITLAEITPARKLGEYLTGEGQFYVENNLFIPDGVTVGNIFGVKVKSQYGAQIIAPRLFIHTEMGYRGYPRIVLTDGASVARYFLGKNFSRDGDDKDFKSKLSISSSSANFSKLANLAANLMDILTILAAIHSFKLTFSQNEKDVIRTGDNEVLYKTILDKIAAALSVNNTVVFDSEDLEDLSVGIHMDTVAKASSGLAMLGGSKMDMELKMYKMKDGVPSVIKCFRDYAAELILLNEEALGRYMTTEATKVEYFTQLVSVFFAGKKQVCHAKLREYVKKGTSEKAISKTIDGTFFFADKPEHESMATKYFDQTKTLCNLTKSEFVNLSQKSFMGAITVVPSFNIGLYGTPSVGLTMRVSKYVLAPTGTAGVRISDVDSKVMDEIYKLRSPVMEMMPEADMEYNPEDF